MFTTFKPKFPEEKMKNLCQLEIFFDYIVHGITDNENNLKYPFKYERSVATYDHPSGRVCVDVQFEYIMDEDMRKFTNYMGIVANVLYTGGHFVKPIDLSLSVPVTVSFKAEEEESNMRPVEVELEVEKIIHRTSKRGEVFTVVWTDGTSTTVKKAEGEVSDEYTAFCYALGKRIFEDKGTARAYIAEKKKVFEDEVAKKSEAKKQRIRAKALQKQYEAEHGEECDEDEVIKAVVYEGMFVPPCLVSKGVFRRNQ